MFSSNLGLSVKYNFVKLHSLVFIVIRPCDSTWLPGACGRFMWLKLYIPSSEYARYPLRGTQNDSRLNFYDKWAASDDQLQNDNTGIVLSLPLPGLDGGQSGGEKGEDITCRVILWSLECVCESVCVGLWWKRGVWRSQSCYNYGERVNRSIF